MASKQLDAILGNTPAATINDEVKKYENIKTQHKQVKMARIVATVPQELKEELKDYLRVHPDETEKTVILSGLKKLGFNVDAKCLLDGRTVR